MSRQSLPTSSPKDFIPIPYPNRTVRCCFFSAARRWAECVGLTAEKKEKDEIDIRRPVGVAISNLGHSGAKRGNPSDKDLYYFTEISVSFRLKNLLGGGGDGGYGKKIQYGCPVLVY